LNEKDIEVLLNLFKTELIELADEILGCLDKWNETGADRALLLKTAKRVAHNIKGSAGTVGKSSIVKLAHELEDMLGRVASEGGDLEPYRDSITRIVSSMLTNDDRPSILPSSHSKPLLQTPPAGAKAPSRDNEQWTTDVLEDEPVAKHHVGTLRVDTTRLDHVLGFTGELFATEAGLISRTRQLKQLAAALSEAAGNGSLEEVKALGKQLTHLAREHGEEVGAFNRLANDLTASMKRLRMIPLRDKAAKWRMTTRTCVEQLGRKARLELRGENVELDKSVLERLEEPLTHLLRNAVDHGIEEPQVRRQAGKPEEGLIRLSAKVNGSVVNITLEDDGRGIDRQRIAEVAIRHQMLSRDKLAHMSDPEVYALLFASGFSTAEKVSTLSGRGIGLSAARAALREFGGTLEAENSKELGGACFRLSVPVSVLSTKALLFRSGRTMLALPVERVEQLVRSRTDELELLEGESAIKVDDSGPIRVRWLSRLFESSEQERKDTCCTIMIVSVTTGRLGLVVDEVLGEKEFVVQSLPWNVSGVHGVAGTVVLANGEVAFVLDPEAFSNAITFDAHSVSAPTERGSKRRVLVVDDSLVARTLESNCLTAAGFEVKLAVDGTQAWELLRQGGFDLIVSDVKMPGLDGFQLTARIRADSAWRHIPIILVTNLQGQEDRVRGLEAGANEYIVKGQMEQEKLLAAVAQLLGDGSKQ
jgi:two-component system chemotaxis sensor kinase CheA